MGVCTVCITRKGYGYYSAQCQTCTSSFSPEKQLILTPTLSGTNIPHEHHTCSLCAQSCSPPLPLSLSLSERPSIGTRIYTFWWRKEVYFTHPVFALGILRGAFQGVLVFDVHLHNVKPRLVSCHPLERMQVYRRGGVAACSNYRSFLPKAHQKDAARQATSSWGTSTHWVV